jgi:hypothetical protein
MGKEITAAMVANDAKVRSTLADYLALSDTDRAADGALDPYVAANVSACFQRFRQHFRGCSTQE